MSEELPGRGDFPHFLSIPTRWMDQDAYGHVNNVEYYSFFDTVVNEHPIREAGLNPRESPVVGMVVETQCRFLSEISFPETIDAGLRVSRLGKSSIVYEIGLFKKGKDAPSATGRFVHYVNRATMKKAPIPDAVRKAVEVLT